MLSLGTDNVIKIWDLKRLKAIHEIQAVGGSSQILASTNSSSTTANNSSNSAINNSATAHNISKVVWAGQSFVTATSSGVVKLYENVANPEAGKLSVCIPTIYRQILYNKIFCFFFYFFFI